MKKVCTKHTVFSCTGIGEGDKRLQDIYPFYFQGSNPEQTLYRCCLHFLKDASTKLHKWCHVISYNGHVFVLPFPDPPVQGLAWTPSTPKFSQAFVLPPQLVCVATVFTTEVCSEHAYDAGEEQRDKQEMIQVSWTVFSLL